METLQIVGVHGIRQRDTNSIKLASDWTRALEQSIAVHCGPDALMPGLTTPYYGDVFPKGRLQLGEDDMTADPAALDEEERDFLRQALEAHTPIVPGQAAPPATLGELPTINPEFTQRVARIDGRFGRGLGTVVISRISEVHGYLTDQKRAEQVRKRVREAVERTGATLIIAHSLGSVVVYDMFQRGLIPLPGVGGSGVDQLITCGSPLGWLPIRHRLSSGEQLRLPSGVTWLNVFDPHDAITGGGGLSSLAPEVTDIRVDNGADPHAADRYLEQAAVATAVTAASVRLASVQRLRQ